MKYIDEYNDAKLVKAVAKKIHRLCGDYRKDIVLMEVCGTHTMAIFRSGLKQLLPQNLKLLSGPGCPVCVTPNEYLDRAAALAQQEKVIIVTFGDMLRVPGSRTSLEKEKAAGARISVVYSPVAALKIAEDNPGDKVVFLAVGFETTIPTIAATIKMAQEKKINNFYVHSGHKLIPPALQALAAGKELKIDGLILPGHVSIIIGRKAYLFLAQDYSIPGVITGFEPLDIIQGLAMLLEQITKRKPAEIEIQYSRCVSEQGNRKALELIADIFTVTDSLWRGLGNIPQSGLVVSDRYLQFDAERNIRVTIPPVKENKKCICGEILTGVKLPTACKLFRTSCTPDNPVGPCMVSTEGTCAAYYKYL